MINEKFVFYVDDDIDDQEMFRDAADEVCENLKIFSAGKDMMDALNNPPPNPTLIFLDLNMPEPNGMQMLNTIRNTKSFDNTPVIIYSTASDSQTADECFNLGADYFLSKSGDFSKMEDSIREVISRDWSKHIRTRANFVHACWESKKLIYFQGINWAIYTFFYAINDDDK